MKLFLFFSYFLVSAVVSANEVSTKDLYTVNAENYEARIEYPVLESNAVPAADKINSQILGLLKSASCTEEDAKESEIGYYYNATADIAALNGNYVSMVVVWDDYCGGAHPNNGTYFQTFDSKTGQEVSMNSQIADQDFEQENFDWDKLQVYQKEIADIMLKYADKNSEEYQTCYGNESEAEFLFTDFFPTIAGLGKDKKVFLKTSPPHVAAICELAVAVPYSEVEKYFSDDSIVKEWMK